MHRRICFIARNEGAWFDLHRSIMYFALETIFCNWSGKLVYCSRPPAANVVAAINRCQNLRQLRLQGSIGVQVAKGIAKALETKSTLERAIWKGMFNGRLEREIPVALVSASSSSSILVFIRRSTVICGLFDRRTWWVVCGWQMLTWWSWIWVTTPWARSEQKDSKFFLKVRSASPFRS